MIRKFTIPLFALLVAIPAFANTSRLSPEQAQPALRLMNDSEFTTFLGRLDSGMLRSQGQLKKMDIQSVSLDPQERQELKKSQERCLQSLDNTRQEIQKLLQRQTLKLDLFLLIDLNGLARNLDSLDQDLVNNVAASGKSLGYAKEVLGIDMALATDISTFQHHLLAFTGVIDATLDHTDSDAPQPQSEK
jgi:hypothetical protein